MTVDTAFISITKVFLEEEKNIVYYCTQGLEGNISKNQVACSM